MARARNIKPGFFKNEDLAECSAWARLCFAGLWCLADREGRLEDRPKRIKGELFPSDTVDVEPLLQELERWKFIHRYETEGVRAIQILKFSEHQTPHYSEKASVIKPPALPEFGAIKKSSSQDDSKKSAPIKRGSQPPDSLIPDSLNPESRILNPEEELRLSPESPRPSDREPDIDLLGHQLNGHAPKTVPDCPHGEILALWAEVMPDLPQHDPSMWPESARADHLRARWRSTAALKGWASKDDGLRYFRKLFGWCRQSDFLMGKAQTRDRRPFEFELAWLVNATNWTKVHEGKFHG